MVIRKLSLSLVFISETKLFLFKAHNLRVQIGFDNCFVVDDMGRSGGLALLWSDLWKVNIQNNSQGHIDTKIISDSDKKKWRFY